MKKVIILISLMISSLAFAGVATSGSTGLIDHPNAYNLRVSNYTVTGIIDGFDNKNSFGVMFEGGFIPQVEAGIKISNKQFNIDEKLMKSNFKFQFVQEADNPAMALGFIEEEDNAYGYLVASKSIKDLFAKDSVSVLSAGLKYDKYKKTNIFGTIDFPIYQKIKLLGEVYTYNDSANNDNSKISFNIGGDFYTTDDIRTKVYFREKGCMLGVMVSYIGIYK